MLTRIAPPPLLATIVRGRTRKPNHIDNDPRLVMKLQDLINIVTKLFRDPTRIIPKILRETQLVRILPIIYPIA